MSITVSGWLMIPRDVWERIKSQLEKYVVQTHEMGKCMDIEVEGMPRTFYEILHNCPGVVCGCK